MGVSESELLERLKKIYPDGKIFAKTYWKSTQPLPAYVHRFARDAGQSTVQWLTEKGFTWQETEPIEPDMRMRDVQKPTGEQIRAIDIAHYVFSRYPLAGEYIPTEEESQILYQSANQTVQKMLQENARITPHEETVLVLETIELLRNWSDGSESGDSGDTFWNYIYMQYGFLPENSRDATNRLYARFRKAIAGTLERYHRFFAPANTTHRYYTSLLLHALAPRRSIEAFFNILFGFYTKDLDFQYDANDPCYRETLIPGLQKRWNAEVTVKNEVKLKSDIVSSGLKTLITERPNYMAALCDSTVHKMDELSRGVETSLLDPEHNGWDRLLKDWYDRISKAERVRVQGEKRRRSAEYVATTKDRIFAQFRMEQELVGIYLPRIRLQEIGTSLPRLVISQNGTVIYDREMSVFGDLILTTRSCFIPLSQTGFDFAQEPQVKVEVNYLGNTLYCSGERLLRSYVLFDETGADRQPRTRTAFLFSSDQTLITFSDEVGVYQLPHDGQLYRINLDEVNSVVVNGSEVFADEQTSSRIRHHASIRKVRQARVMVQDQQVELYSGPVSFAIKLPPEEPEARFQLSCDGIHYPILSLPHREGEIEVPPMEETEQIHTVKVVDLTSGFVKYDFKFIILPGFRMTLDRTIYRPGVDTVSLLLRWNGGQFQDEIPLSTGNDNLQVSVSDLGMEFELDIPTIQCTFMKRNAFLMPEYVWHTNISPGECMSLTLPIGWNVHVMLGVNEIPLSSEGAYELGNALRSGKYHQTGNADLWLSLYNDQGQRERYLITRIVFQPCFLYDPLETMDQELLWLPQGNYIGETASQMRVEITSPEGSVESFAVSDRNANLVSMKGRRSGRYFYRVLLQRKGLFAGNIEEEIRQGGFVFGDPNEFRFDGQEIELDGALCWDFDENLLKTIPIRPRCGIISSFRYSGVSAPSGESVPMPCYTAMLSFEDQHGRRIPFNSKPSEEFELVNPVSIWVINEHLLILRCVTDDTVYIDKKYSTIANRDPNRIMSSVERKSRLETPDYFEYTLKEEERHV